MTPFTVRWRSVPKHDGIQQYVCTGGAFNCTHIMGAVGPSAVEPGMFWWCSLQYTGADTVRGLCATMEEARSEVEALQAPFLATVEHQKPAIVTMGNPVGIERVQFT